jgi:hypothetical protein
LKSHRRTCLTRPAHQVLWPSQPNCGRCASKAIGFARFFAILRRCSFGCGFSESDGCNCANASRIRALAETSARCQNRGAGIFVRVLRRNSGGKAGIVNDALRQFLIGMNMNADHGQIRVCPSYDRQFRQICIHVGADRRGGPGNTQKVRLGRSPPWAYAQKSFDTTPSRPGALFLKQPLKEKCRPLHEIAMRAGCCIGARTQCATPAVYPPDRCKSGSTDSASRAATSVAGQTGCCSGVSAACSSGVSKPICTGSSFVRHGAKSAVTEAADGCGQKSAWPLME